MAISGLILTHTDDDSVNRVTSALEADRRVTLGERFGLRRAIVAQTSSAAEDRALFDELRALSGVLNVDVVYVHLDDDQRRSVCNAVR